MELFNKLPRRSGIYYIKDNIEHLQLRINFRQVNTLLQLPKFDLNKNVLAKYPADVATGTNLRDTAKRKESPSASSTTVEINWQQKILSTSERQLYKELSNCITDVQKKYHQQLSEEESRTRKTKADNARKRSRLKRRNRRRSSANDSEDEATADDAHDYDILFTYVAEDHFTPQHPAETVSDNDRRVFEDPETMYVYASLNPDTQLLALSWYPEERMLHIYPDFNGMNDNPYFIEIDSDYRQLYAYAVENTSRARLPTIAATTAQYIQLPELLAHWSAADADHCSGFARPPKHQQRMSLLLEIRAAAGLDYDNVHVRYHVTLPAATILEEGALIASTHSSSPSHGSADGSCHFNHTCQLTLLCEEAYDATELLHIYFELISIDGWERERVEGYAHYATYLRPGSDALRLHCMRPTGGWMDALRRYFIGGRVHFDAVHFFTGSADESEFRSRYKCRMHTTGWLDISCQRLVQQNSELLQSSSQTPGMTLDDIMVSYREARQRLEDLIF